MAGQTTVQGRDRLRRRLAALPKAARQDIRVSLEKGAQEVVSAQRRLAPVGDSDLVNSIGYTVGPVEEQRGAGGLVSAAAVGDPDLSVAVHAGDEKAFYARWVEFGTRPFTAGGTHAGAVHPGTVAQPFFYPGYRLLRKRIVGRVTRATRKSARDAAKGGA